MIPNLHYSLEALFYRQDIGDKFDFLKNNGDITASLTNYKKEFRDDSPIIARENAFKHYQSMIDVLYDNLNLTYTSDEQARIDLQRYFNSGNDVELLKGSPKKFKVSDDLFNGVNIYLMVDESSSNDHKKPNKILIHGIRYLEDSMQVDEEIPLSIKGLIAECKCYEQGLYPVKDHYTFVNFHEIGGNAEILLRTPFNWDSWIEKYKGLDLL